MCHGVCEKGRDTHTLGELTVTEQWSDFPN